MKFSTLNSAILLGAGAVSAIPLEKHFSKASRDAQEDSRLAGLGK